MPLSSALAITLAAEQRAALECLVRAHGTPQQVHGVELRPKDLAAEQVCAIIALACEPPSASGRPITHWSQSELAREAVRRGVAERISQRSVGRMLKRSRPQAALGASLAHAQA